MPSRCLLLNIDYSFLDILEWQDAVCLMIEEKAHPLSTYNEPVRSQYISFMAPAVLQMKYYVKTKSKKNKFNSVSRKAILIRDNFKCQYCGCSLSNGTATLDHVLPRSRGGLHKFDNVVASCKSCNNLKDDMTAKEFEKWVDKKSGIQGRPLIAKPRTLNDEEKIKCIIKSFKSKERSIWLETLKEIGITLW